jgi:uncharacterized protein YjbI with pentapeptide repeats
MCHGGNFAKPRSERANEPFLDKSATDLHGCDLHGCDLHDYDLHDYDLRNYDPAIVSP